MDDASGRAAAGQIPLRAQKAHDEECVIGGSPLVGAPCFSKGSWTLVQRKRDLL